MYESLVRFRTRLSSFLGKADSGIILPMRLFNTVLLAACICFISCSSNRPSSAPKDETASTSKASPLTYEELVTGGASTAQTLPMIIAVHGMGDRPENFKELFSDFPKAARVILPQAPKSYFSGYSWFDIRFPISRSAEELSPGIRAAAKLVSTLLLKLSKELPTEGKPAITGFSQGGAISYAAAAMYPSFIAFAVPLSGAIPPSLYPPKSDVPPPPICAAHGDKDELIPIEGARQSVRAFNAAGGRASLTEIAGLRHTVDSSMREFLFDKLQHCSASVGR
jgi:phospholipase/carboxylesterase